MDVSGNPFGIICRTCMTRDEVFHSILEMVDNKLRIFEVLSKTTPQILIDINDSDKLPKMICKACLYKLDITYKFQQMLISSEKHMRSLLSNKQNVVVCKNTIGGPLMQSGELPLQPHLIKRESTEEKNLDEFLNFIKVEVTEIETNQNEGITEIKTNLDADDPIHLLKCDNQSVKEETNLKEFNVNDSIESRSADCSKCLIDTECKNEIEKFNDKSIQCDICQESFNRLCLLAKHMRSHPNCPKYKCTICKKIFHVNTLYSEHLNTHAIEEKKVCAYCEKIFQTDRKLKDHMTMHTGEKQYLCSQCGKAFLKANGLYEHMLRHSSEKKYQCPECPSKFPCHSDIAKHMSVHKNIKPFKCDICESSFTRSYTLRKHKHIHSGERPNKCNQCSKSFVTIDQLRRHIRTHTGEKPYKCTLCEQAYAQSGDLRKHMRIHIGDKQYKCNQCPEAFKYLTELRKHQTSHFKEQQPSQQIL